MNNWMTFQSIKIWLRMLGRRLDRDVAAINGTNNSWKTTQRFKILCYLYSFSTLFKRRKDLYLLHSSMIFIRLELKEFGKNICFRLTFVQPQFVLLCWHILIRDWHCNSFFNSLICIFLTNIHCRSSVVV